MAQYNVEIDAKITVAVFDSDMVSEDDHASIIARRELHDHLFRSVRVVDAEMSDAVIVSITPQNT